MPAVSILLTCYNHLPYLKEAVAGVVAQTFTDWEIIAIDDGSTDGTREWLSSTDVPMKVILNETNLGTYETLNRALGASSGRYIAVLNDDDLWTPTKLEKQLAAMESSPKVGLVHTGGHFIDQNSQPISDPKPLGFAYPRTGNGDVLAELIAFNKVINSSALVRREAFDQVGLWDAAFYGCGDWHLWLRIAKEFDVRYIEEDLTLYRVHPTNASRDEEKMIDDSRRIREWIATWSFEEVKSRPGVIDALALNFASLGTERMWKGDRSSARDAYGRSLRLKPGRFKTYLRLAATYLPSKVFRSLG